MKFGSVCSGIEAATEAWKPLGWKAAWYSEIEKFPSAVLAHRHPETPNYGDMTKFKEWPDATLDVFVGGTPCQSFSVAGLRKGLDDPRGNLMLTYCAIADRYRPRWLVWENVPGVLSSNGGRDFGTFVGALGELGYGFAYRVLDAQYCGVPQRRRRVFVVGYLGDWRRAAAVLFERHSLQGHSAPSRQTREEVAGPPAFGIDEECNVSEDHYSPLLRGGQGGTRQTVAFPANLSATQCASTADLAPAMGARNPTAVALPINTQIATRGGKMGRGTGFGIGDDGDPGYTLQAGHSHAVAFAENSRNELRLEGGDGQRVGALSTGGGKPGQGTPMIAQTFDMRGRGDGNTVNTLCTDHASRPSDYCPVAVADMAVRRLTPVECARLQGFPDHHTQIPWNGKKAEDCPDGPQYKAYGNSMAVPVMHWLGKRIEQADMLKYT